MVDQQSSDLADRYGAKGPQTRIVALVLTCLLAGAGLGWLAWAAWFNAHPTVNAAVLGFEVQGEHTMQVKVQARQNDYDIPGVCTLQVRADDHSIVGERRVEINVTDDGWVGTGKTRQRSYEVRTEREATSVEVVRCGPAPR